MPTDKKVLVCDDELYILESVTYVVREEGFAVFAAEDGEEAIDKARVERPNLMLLDIGMAKKNGFDVCRVLKADPATKEIYIILLTSSGQDRDVEEAYRSGADEYMTKPFSPRSLRRRLHELLD